jgi:hypothetical protein
MRYLLLTGGPPILPDMRYLILANHSGEREQNAGYGR